MVIGVKSVPIGLEKCHNCGFENCDAMAAAGTNCAFNITDIAERLPTGGRFPPGRFMYLSASKRTT